MRQDYQADLVAVVLDTLGLAACFENEDKAAQVLKVVAGLGKLSDATGALSIVIDHFGKNQQAGLRGSSAKRDCASSSFRPPCKISCSEIDPWQSKSTTSTCLPRSARQAAMFAVSVVLPTPPFWVAKRRIGMLLFNFFS
jgi:hypothetical protein